MLILLGDISQTYIGYRPFQLICNHQVVSSSLITGSIFTISYGHSSGGRFFVVATSLPSFFYHIGMIELVKALRYATIRQLSTYLEEPYQNTAKKLRRLNIRHFQHQGKNIYTLERKNPRFTDHELLVTDTLVLIRPHTYKRTGISTDDINPDAFYETEQGNFYLEVENSAGHPSIPDLVEKAWKYLGSKGRVHFDLPSEAMARKLCEAIRQSGIKHLGKFWVSWRGNEAISPNGNSYQLRTSLITDNLVENQH